MTKPIIEFISPKEVYTIRFTPLEVRPLSGDDFLPNFHVWNFGDGTTSTDKIARHNYKDAGRYNVTLTQYLTSGEAVTSDIEEITAYNLVPNSMNWTNDSYDSFFLRASRFPSTPFKFKFYNSHQYAEEYAEFELYASNSLSIPFNPQDKRMHLKPVWQFYDKEFEETVTLKIKTQPLYANFIGGQLNVTTVPTEDSEFVGVMGEGEFNYKDDIPSGVVENNEDFTPVVINVNQKLNTTNDTKVKDEPTVSYPPLKKILFITNNPPDDLSITTNGIFDFPILIFKNVEIPYNIFIRDEEGELIKALLENEDSQVYPIEIGFKGSVTPEIADPIDFLNKTISNYSIDFSTLGGFTEGSFIPIETTSEQNITLTASTQVDFVVPRINTLIGGFADENSDNIYRIFYFPNSVVNFNRQEAISITSEKIDGFISNKFGVNVDNEYNLSFLDSDKSEIVFYDDEFNYIKSISLSAFDENIVGHTSPAQSVLDGDNNLFITLYDAAKVAAINSTRDTVTITDVQSAFDSGSVPFSGENFYEPTAIEVTRGGEVFVSYTTSLNHNFVERFEVNSNLELILAGTTLFGSIQIVDMVSNRDGSIMYMLGIDDSNEETVIYNYNLSTNVVNNTETFGGYSEYLSINENQSAVFSLGSTQFVVWGGGATQIFDLSNFFNYPNVDEQRERFIGGISGDSFGNIWVIDRYYKKVHIFNISTSSIMESISIQPDSNNQVVAYVAYGDWTGFRWANKFGDGKQVTTLSLSGESTPFQIERAEQFNLQKINEDFDMTKSLKSYRTTDALLSHDKFFDEFVGSIVGNARDDGTFIGKNIYERIANFVMNHSDPETCNTQMLESMGQMVGVDIEQNVNFPRDIKRFVDLFSIKFKHLWGDLTRKGEIENFVGEELDIDSYIVSSNPPEKFILKEKFNNQYQLIVPLEVTIDPQNIITYNNQPITYLGIIVTYNSPSSQVLSSYPISGYNPSWGWGLSIPQGGILSDYYEIYEYNPPEEEKIYSIIDWNNPLTSKELSSIENYSNYMTEDGIVTNILGSQLRRGLGLFKE